MCTETQRRNRQSKLMIEVKMTVIIIPESYRCVEADGGRGKGGEAGGCGGGGEVSEEEEDGGSATKRDTLSLKLERMAGQQGRVGVGWCT